MTIDEIQTLDSSPVATTAPPEVIDSAQPSDPTQVNSEPTILAEAVAHSPQTITEESTPVAPSAETVSPESAHSSHTEVVENPVEELKPVAEAPKENSPAPVKPATEVKVADDIDLFGAFWDDSAPKKSESDRAYEFNRGDIIDATIIEVQKTRVFVNLGTKTEAEIPLNELSEEPLDSAENHFKVGDVIRVVVIRTDGKDRNPVVSRRRAEAEQAWEVIEKAFQNGEMLNAKVLERVKGGLVVDVGVRGFVPATQVGNGRLRHIEKYVGTEIQLKVIDLDREKKKVVLSNREAEDLRRADAKESIFSTTKVDDIIDGTIRRLTEYGAFVDLGGVDGLLHISEMSWSRINHPKEIFKEGQKIKVQVLKLDAEAGKISLGHRQVLPDPWKAIKEVYTVGQVIPITITRIAASGAFIRLPEGAEAFMPMSEMSEQRVNSPEEVLQPGQEVEARILDLKPDQRRMVLTLRDKSSTDREPFRAPIPTTFEGDRSRSSSSGPGAKKVRKGGRGGRDSYEDFDDSSRRSFATGGATIGERLGALRGFFRRTEEEGTEGKAAEKKAEPSDSEPAKE